MFAVPIRFDKVGPRLIPEFPASEIAATALAIANYTLVGAIEIACHFYCVIDIDLINFMPLSILFEFISIMAFEHTK